MKPDDQTRIKHMIDSSLEAISFLGTISAEELADNRLVSNAIVRSIEIVGEAASQITKSFRDAHPQIPWEKIIGMRNRIVHAYFEVDYEMVWSTVHEDLPVLLKQLKEIVK